MTLWKYKYFIDVVDTKSFTKAGKKNYVSQTAISQQISSLEKNIGGTLIERGTGEITVTELGRIVYRRAKEMLEISELMRQEVDDYKKRYVVRIGIDSSINKKFWRKMQEMIDRFYSEEEFQFRKIDCETGSRMLKENSLDIYIGYGLNMEQSRGFTELEIARNPLGIYFGRNSTIPNSDEVMLEELNGYKRYGTNQYPCSMIEDSAELFQKNCRKIRCVDNTDTMKLKAEFNDGYAFVDSYYFSECDGDIRLLGDYDAVCSLKLFYKKDKDKHKMNDVLETVKKIIL